MASWCNIRSWVDNCLHLIEPNLSWWPHIIIICRHYSSHSWNNWFAFLIKFICYVCHLSLVFTKICYKTWEVTLLWQMCLLDASVFGYDVWSMGEGLLLSQILSFLSERCHISLLNRYIILSCPIDGRHIWLENIRNMVRKKILRLRCIS